MGTPTGLNRLPELIERLASYESSHVVVAVDGPSNYYVQLASGERDENDEGWLLCEAVSNEFLEGEDRISPAVEAALIDVGWKAPRSECSQAGCQLENPNF